MSNPSDDDYPEDDDSNIYEQNTTSDAPENNDNDCADDSDNQHDESNEDNSVDDESNEDNSVDNESSEYTYPSKDSGNEYEEEEEDTYNYHNQGNPSLYGSDPNSLDNPNIPDPNETQNSNGYHYPTGYDNLTEGKSGGYERYIDYTLSSDVDPFQHDYTEY
ncbi:hypothetical protein H4219_002844 [Mycoemilia scoparia]|uniref:Uncharacterized protein n=1 Tax=Mycoemilia scoparia TaxID=417184 RepID=A0A9W8A283_9FUNG|nr:hypothetical protein H4219_002844 [Mycoemilia scoparia]